MGRRLRIGGRGAGREDERLEDRERLREGGEDRGRRQKLEEEGVGQGGRAEGPGEEKGSQGEVGYPGRDRRKMEIRARKAGRRGL